MKRNKTQDQVETVNPKRRLGMLKGQIQLPDNFEEIDKELDKEIEELFYSSELEPPARESARAAKRPAKKLKTKS